MRGADLPHYLDNAVENNQINLKIIKENCKMDEWDAFLY
uniref:Uncharacterized protein n=1 Tax=Arundo donax TaxID=35708 RepID=A0A0A9BJC3_ARUDO